MRARAASAAALLVALLAAGCGSGGTTTTTRIHLVLTPQERHGKTLFVQHCGSCHTLADAGTTGNVGPPFDQPWEASRVQETIADGPGLMPAALVRGNDAAAVAAYVAAATGG